jgi:hypothetical protein
MTLVAHWACDDNAASTTVVATVGSNGTLAGGDNTSAKTTTGPGGTITAGLLFNGTDDNIDITASALSFADTVAFSVSMWFKRSGTIARLIGVDNSANSRILGADDTTIRIVTSGGGSSNFTVPSMGTAAWHHLLLTRTTANAVRVFLDGTESATGSLTSGGIQAWDAIGRQANLFSNGFAVAQVKVFDSDESGNVATLYAEGVGGVADDPAFMMGFFQA